MSDDDLYIPNKFGSPEEKAAFLKREESELLLEEKGLSDFCTLSRQTPHSVRVSYYIDNENGFTFFRGLVVPVALTNLLMWLGGWVFVFAIIPIMIAAGLTLKPIRRMHMQSVVPQRTLDSLARNRDAPNIVLNYVGGSIKSDGNLTWSSVLGREYRLEAEVRSRKERIARIRKTEVLSSAEREIIARSTARGSASRK